MWIKVLLIVIGSLIGFYFLSGFLAVNIVYNKNYRRTAKHRDQNVVSNLHLKEGDDWYPYFNDLVETIKFYESLNLEDIYIESFDGLKLHANYYPADIKSNKYIISVHGFGGNGYHNSATAALTRKHRDYNVLFIDCRGHGKSEGNCVTFGVLDCQDLVKWEEYMHQRFGNDINLFIHGVSMGGATSLMAADKLHNVQAIIADCGFNSNYDICKDIATNMVGLFGKSTMPLLRLTVKLRGHYDIKKENTYESLKNVDTPILFIHGGKDNYVPSYMSENNYKNKKGIKEIKIFENSGHALSFVQNQEEYEKIMYNFFEKYKK